MTSHMLGVALPDDVHLEVNVLVDLFLVGAQGDWGRKMVGKGVTPFVP